MEPAHFRKLVLIFFFFSFNQRNPSDASKPVIFLKKMFPFSHMWSLRSINLEKKILFKNLESMGGCEVSVAQIVKFLVMIISLRLNITAYIYSHLFFQW